MKPKTAAFRFAVMALALGSGVAAAQSPTSAAGDDEALFQAWRTQCQSQRRADCDDYEVFKTETYPPGHRCLKQSGRCQSTTTPTTGTGTATGTATATPQYETGAKAPSNTPAPAVIPQGEPATGKPARR